MEGRGGEDKEEGGENSLEDVIFSWCLAFKIYFYLCVHLYASMHMCIGYLRRPEEGVGCPGAGVTRWL